MTILIIGAMDKEISALSSAFNAKPDEKGNLTASVGVNKVVIATSGVGKVNAAATTQRLICQYSPDFVINTGVAGGIANDITLGETVIAKKLTYHDFNPLDILLRYPPYSTMFECDTTLTELARQACEKLNVKHRMGVVVSGDCFVNDADVKADIQNRFSADCTEMEGAAIAHTCMVNSVKFLVIRAVCDFADSTADMINAFEDTAAKTAALITEYIINNL